MIFLLDLFIQNTCDHGKFTLDSISHVLTTKFHSDKFWPNQKKQEKKTTNRCQLLPSLKKTCVLKDKKIPSLQPENTHLGPPRHVGIPGPSSYPSQQRLFPRAAVPVGVAPGGETPRVYGVETVVFQQLKGNGKMEFVWQKTKTNKTSPLPIERGWSPYLQVLQLGVFLVGRKKMGWTWISSPSLVREHLILETTT